MFLNLIGNKRRKIDSLGGMRVPRADEVENGVALESYSELNNDGSPPGSGFAVAHQSADVRP